VATSPAPPSSSTAGSRSPSGVSGHLAGQHVDIRLTAEDGYTAQRSYSISAPADGELIEVTVQLVADGEVSSYLVREIQEGDAVEVLGPLGGWFVLHPKQSEPVLLIGGGSGVAPLTAMLRARMGANTRLIYSVLAHQPVVSVFR
jgi:ferredoxin-NADP reductase